jgi:LuxR family maltose regulon positive regulatory protein
MASYWLDQQAQARPYLEEIIGVGRELLPLAALVALGALALMDCESEDWNAVAKRLHEGRQMIASGGLGEYWMTAGVELASGLAAEHNGDLARSEALMARSLVLCRRSRAPVETANALLHLARIHQSQRLDTVAAAEVDEATMLIQACPAPGPRIQRLLARVRRSARRATPTSRRARGVEELSRRELRVLRLLASELTQREIGTELYLSLNTIKSHTRSIFRKLGVSSRAQAVARARELELI